VAWPIGGIHNGECLAGRLGGSQDEGVVVPVTNGHRRGADRDRLGSAIAPLRAREQPGAPAARQRVHVCGKFFFRGDEKLYLKGVTYGTFAPLADGSQYPSPQRVDDDFAQMARAGVNSLRTYTVPPKWLLDLAFEHGLTVMVGLPWEQHVDFLADKERRDSIQDRVVAAAKACASHPALLALTVGNEIPGPIVRWRGRRTIERFVNELYQRVKDEDPEALVTYVNYPTTEYLELPFLDFASFNVYLEHRETLSAYLARLQNLTGDRPLVMAELGLDSRRNGEQKQAETLAWQLRTAFDSGCAGAYAFAWTDEWHRGGHAIEDWDFGLTTRDRSPKPALRAVTTSFEDVPFAATRAWPRISVVICTYNGSRTLAETLRATSALDYPDYEVIVVDDGSTDGSGAIAAEHACKVVRTENRGLSSARNTGVAAATGTIVAFLDDDAYPDPHWLRYLAVSFTDTGYVAVGGPNIPPGGDTPTAQAVAHAPGGPIHVLTSDTDAEHLPGCNLAIRRAQLEEIGGFDPEFTTAGDDVDICWRLDERGWKLGFNPAAVVFHHRRNSIRAYWRQQRGYGRAEALLERKWPEKYNVTGHVSWGGRLYNGIRSDTPIRRWRVYHGIWGTAPFQSLYERRAATISQFPLMPEWYLLLTVFAAFSALGLLWTPLLAAVPLLVAGLGLVLAEATASVQRIGLDPVARSLASRVQLRTLAFLLFLLQPAARLLGRARSGLTPWRRHGELRALSPYRRRWTVWREDWRPPEIWLAELEQRVRSRRVSVMPGGPYDSWDLETRGGIFGGVRVRMVVEEHGEGRQLARFHAQLRPSRIGVAITLLLAALGGAAAFDHHWIVGALLTATAVAIAVRTLIELAVAFGALPGRGELAELVRRRRYRTRRAGDRRPAEEGPGAQRPAVAGTGRRFTRYVARTSERRSRSS
jgi:GT2 family glycosyltransferase